ncbi:MAG: hypothetical protein ACLFVU_03860 [Phycisphaerae bacterium]
MSPDHNQRKDRTERLLRQWGAEEYMRRVDPPAPPQLADAGSPRRRATPTWLRWLPTAAAAALLIGAMVVYFSRPDQPRPEPTGPDPSVARLKTQLRQAENEAAKLRSGLNKNRRALALVRDDRDRLQLQVERLEEASRSADQALAQSLKQSREQLTGRYEKELGELANALVEQQNLLESERQRVRTLKQYVQRADAAMEQIAAARDDAQKRNRVLQSRLEELRDDYDKALIAHRKAAGKLADLRHQRDKWMEDFQGVYLAAAAPGESGLMARKTALRRTRILSRLMRVRRNAASVTTVRLLETVEVVLTRLDMINPDIHAESEAFAQLVEESDVMETIDSILASRGEHQPMRSLLFEVKLLLKGVEDVA